jgi:hypothetical protein
VVVSWRSIGAGLLAACLAFLVAYFINPVHFSVLGATLLILSGLAGFSASAILGKKFARHNSDQRAAVMVFAFIFFVGVYAPISAIWANAPLYSWTTGHKLKPKSELLAPVIATALEKTATSNYLGMFVLFGIAYLLPKWSERKTPSSKRDETSAVLRLGWVDIALGIFALLQSFICAFTIFNIVIDLANVFALLCLAFLQCFLFRSLRLHCQSLWKQPSPDGVKHLSKPAGAILILCLVLCVIACLLISPFQMSTVTSRSLIRGTCRFALCTLILLLPLLVYRLFVRGHPATSEDQLAPANQFATRCGFWALLGMFLIVGGLVLRGLAQKEFNSAPPNFAIPFAYSMIALTPVFPSGALLFLFAVFGGFFIALLLPHGILARHRILASAHGGVVGGTVFFSLLFVLALSLALCTVPCIPLPGPPFQTDTHLTHLLLADGKWPLIGSLYVVTAFCWAACLASIWAIEAVFACVIIWIKKILLDQWVVIARSANPEAPTKNPPLAPNA